TSSFLSGNQTTAGAVAEPTTASSALSFTNVHSYQMTLNWTSGNGSGRMIIMNQGSPVTFTPVDGTTYSAYQSVGSGNLILYNGSASSFTASNDGYGPLANNTAYYFAIFDYNGSSTQINYLTSTFLAGNQTTLVSGRLGEENGSTDLSAAELKVYPVPATSFVNITVNGSQANQELLFYSYTGDLVNRMFVQTGAPVQLDLSSWKRGLYFVKSSNENGDLIQKIILQ
ncbi:MAG: T9SS type A sorting domain-containing protein, partial [Cytophagaceae bacterium]|nr:T9SS type A sorting domain-containing protein [Cytophagaceae bacterium]